MRTIGAILGTIALTGITFFPLPAATITIHVGSFYFHVPFAVHHHRYRSHKGGNDRTAARTAGETEATSPKNCSGLVPGLTNLPIAQIRETVHPTAEQDAAFDDLSAALSQASDAIKSSCPSTVPLTPISRLDATEQRLDATIKAARIIRPPLANLYDALNDEQKLRFKAIYGSPQRGRSGTNVAAACSQQGGSFVQLPVQRIESVLELTPQQQAAFDNLIDATRRAADRLQSSCPTDLPHSPVARLDLVEARLKAIAAAIEAVRPALVNFYAVLNDEQKAKFNVVGPRAE